MRSWTRWGGLAALFLVAVAAIVRGVQYGLATEDGPGPGLFPVLSGLLAGGGCVAVGFEMFRATAAPGEARDGALPTPGRLLGYAAIIVIWPLLLQPLGYALSSGLALLALLRVGGLSWARSLAFAALAVAGSVLLFSTLLEVPLPGPRWG